MVPPGTTLHVAPARLEQLQRADGPRPLPPPSWVLLTDVRWGELRRAFGLPDIGNGVALRAYLEWTCVGLIESRNESTIRDQCKSDDNVIRWMSKAANIGRPLEHAIGRHVICRLSYIAERMNEAAGRTIVRPDEFANARALTIPMQLCALACRDLAGRSLHSKHVSPIIEFYAALWRAWVEYLGRPATLWAQEGGSGASAFVRFVTCLLRWSREPMPDDDAVAWKNVRTRLSHARQRHPQCFIPPDPTAAQEFATTVCAAAIPEWRLRLRRRTRRSGFSRCWARA